MLLLLLCVWPPVRAVCPNHKVVVFQTQTETALELGSVAIFTTFILAPPVPPVSTVVLDLYILPFILPPPHQYPFVVVSHLS